MRTILAALVLLGIASAADAATTIYPGKWSFTFVDQKGWGAERPIKVYTFRPKACDTKCPIWIVLAGGKRNASQYRDHWEFLANKGNFLVVAPEFLDSQWKGAAGYNLGEMKIAQENRERSTFAAIEHLFDEVRDGQQGYKLFGHSAGAQLVMRMAMLRPDSRASLYVAANPGWYTQPEWRADKTKLEWPHSLVKSKATEADLRQALSRRVIVLHTERDDEPDEDKEYPGAEMRKAGGTRISRGEAFFQALDNASAELGTPPPAWELIKVPDKDFDAYEMSRYAAEKLPKQ